MLDLSFQFSGELRRGDGSRLTLTNLVNLMKLLVARGWGWCIFHNSNGQFLGDFARSSFLASSTAAEILAVIEAIELA